jgi:hypothetical protein
MWAREREKKAVVLGKFVMEKDSGDTNRKNTVPIPL